MKNAIFSVGIAMLLSLASCSRTSSDLVTPDQASNLATSAATVNASINSVQTDVVQANYQGFYGISTTASSTGKPGDLDSNYLGCLKGATVTKSTVNGVTTITIDYGAGITDDHGRTKAGQIVITTSGSIKTKDLSTTVTFKAFSINGNVQNGTLNFSFALNANGNPVMTRSEDISITKADGSGTVSRKGTFTRTMTSGYATPKDVSDDVWTETGSATMTDSTGTYSVTIKNPVVFPVACGNPVSGTIIFDKIGSVYSLDYGTGTCDNIATLTKPDGTVVNITIDMPKRGH